MDDRIKVIDSPLGSGKTSWAINYINQLPEDRKVIFITPFITECNRVVEQCASKNFIQPNTKNSKGTKSYSFIQLIEQGYNVVSTHALFSIVDDVLINLLRSSDYILVLDEVMNVVDKPDIYKDNRKITEENKDKNTKKDIQSLLSKNYISVDDDFTVHWVNEEDTLTKYANVKKMADRNILYLINKSLLVWTFPIEIFRPGIFDEIYILTYLFKYQIQCSYYQFFELEYSLYHIEKVNDQYTLKETINYDYETQWRYKISSLINIPDNPKLNRIGSIYYNARNLPIETALSDSWYRNKETPKSKMKDNLSNYFQNITHSKVDERLWTCFKEDIPLIKSKNVSAKQWLEINARSTNLYREKTVLAYCINKYINPFFDEFFNKRNIILNQEGYAITELLQWIFRSALRDGKPVTLYLPSERMRILFAKWQNNEL